MPILAWTFSGKNTSILTKNKALIKWFSSRKRSIKVLWKRLLPFECEGVLKMKKVKNNRGLVQRYQWSWKIHVRDLREHTRYDKKEHRNWQFKLQLYTVTLFLDGILFTTPWKSAWSCDWICANCKKVKIKNERSSCYVY